MPASQNNSNPRGYLKYQYKTNNKTYVKKRKCRDNEKINK